MVIPWPPPDARSTVEDKPSSRGGLTARAELCLYGSFFPEWNNPLKPSYPFAQKSLTTFLSGLE